MRTSRAFTAGAFLLLGMTQLPRGQLFAQIYAPQSVLSAGGGVLAGNGFTIQGTIGQPVAGTTTGFRSGFWQAARVVATAREEVKLPEIEPLTNRLYQNYPNPFNPSTTITFDLAENGPVLLTVFDVLGREVATLVDAPLNPGRHSVDWVAGTNGSGLYFYRLKSGAFVNTRGMFLQK